MCPKKAEDTAKSTKAKKKEAPEEEAPKKAETTAKSKSGGKKVLVVEDEGPLAHALELKLGHEHLDTITASNGAAGLDMVTKDKSIKAILLDLIMPQMDGFAFMEELKKRKVKVPVIILSNLGQEEDRKRAEELGATGYYVKSNTPISEIVKKVSALI